MKDTDEVFDTVEVLLRSGREVEAVALLRAAATECAASDDVAFLNSMLGSVLALIGQDKEALEAYRAAEIARPDEPGLKLSTARHLLVEMGNARDAKTKASEVRQMSGTGASVQHSALAILGGAHLEMGQRDEAMSALVAAIDLAMQATLPPESCDLNLVGVAVRCGLIRSAGEKAHVVKYLSGVASAARAVDRPEVESTAKALLQEMHSGP